MPDREGFRGPLRWPPGCGEFWRVRPSLFGANHTTPRASALIRQDGERQMMNQLRFTAEQLSSPRARGRAILLGPVWGAALALSAVAGGARRSHDRQFRLWPEGADG